MPPRCPARQRERTRCALLSVAVPPTMPATASPSRTTSERRAGADARDQRTQVEPIRLEQNGLASSDHAAAVGRGDSSVWAAWAALGETSRMAGHSVRKPQFFSHVAALRAWRAATGSLPGNVKFIVEGEEECGSVNLDATVQAHRDLFAADPVSTSDDPVGDDRYAEISFAPAACSTPTGSWPARRSTSPASPAATAAAGQPRAMSAGNRYEESSRKCRRLEVFRLIPGISDLLLVGGDATPDGDHQAAGREHRRHVFTAGERTKPIRDRRQLRPQDPSSGTRLHGPTGTQCSLLNRNHSRPRRPALTGGKPLVPIRRNRTWSE
jgi:hypothetical protein